MKYLNLTNTTVLLYDNEKMLGQIDPGAVSSDIPDELASRSPTIARFLEKGVIAVYKGEKVAAQQPKPFRESVEAGYPSGDRVMETPTKTPAGIKVQKETPIARSKASSIDYVPGADDNDLGSVIVPGKNPIEAKEEKVTKVIRKAMDKNKETLEKVGNEIEKEEKEKEADKEKAAKLAKAPEDIREFIKLRFLAKKWKVAKATDKEWLAKIAEYDSSVEKIVKQRLEEIK